MTALRVTKKNLIENVQAIVSEMGASAVIGVCKGNGYGLGTLPFAQALLEGGASFLAVARLSDAKILRDGGMDPAILLMTPICSPEEADLAVLLRLTCAVDSVSCALLLNTAAKESNVRLDIHIKIDTGFGRYGFPPDCAKEVKEIKDGCDFLCITGTFSHLSNAFGKKKADTLLQGERFQTACASLENAGIEPGLRHLANSAGALRFPQLRLDGVRIGSAFTGRMQLGRCPVLLKPVCTLTTQISEVRWLPKGANIGYANLFQTKQPTKIAILPVGYGDGFCTEKSRDTFRFMDILRYLFTDAKLLLRRSSLSCQIAGTRCRLLGRVGLTNCTAEITALDCSVGETASFSVNPMMLHESIERIYE